MKVKLLERRVGGGVSGRCVAANRWSGGGRAEPRVEKPGAAGDSCAGDSVHISKYSFLTEYSGTAV